MKERRWKFLECTYDWLVCDFVEGKAQICEMGLPDRDFKVISITVNPLTSKLNIILEHDSFDVVSEGGEIPRFSPIFRVLDEKSMFDTDSEKKGATNE